MTRKIKEMGSTYNKDCVPEGDCKAGFLSRQRPAIRPESSFSSPSCFRFCTPAPVLKCPYQDVLYSHEQCFAHFGPLVSHLQHVKLFPSCSLLQPVTKPIQMPILPWPTPPCPQTPLCASSVHKHSFHVRKGIYCTASGFKHFPASFL